MWGRIARPCQRCIKRNLATTCTDGARKKAKYLQDIDGIAFYIDQRIFFFFLIISSTDTTAPSTASNTPFSPQSIQTPNLNTSFDVNSFNTQNFLNTGKSYMVIFKQTKCMIRFIRYTNYFYR